jgi:GT2 family glycosyltransferase
MAQYASRPLAQWELEGLYPSIAVIILNYRESEMTAACLRSINSLRYPGEVEAIIVENGSGDGSIDRLRAEAEKSATPARVVATETNLGFTGGVLKGCREVAGDLICLLNNDATFHPDCLTRLVDAFRGRRDLGAVWPFDAPHGWREMLRIPNPDNVALMRNGTHSLVGNNIWFPLLSDYKECFTPSGVCLLFPRNDDPLFPAEYFAYYEDVYFGWRLQLRGLKAERVPDAVIYHEGSRTGRFDPELRRALAVHVEKNRLANLIIFYGASTFIRIVPLLLLDEAQKLFRILAAIMTGRDGMAKLKAYFLARLWVLRHANWLRLTRERVQAERCVPDRQIVPLMSGCLTMVNNSAGRFINLIALGYCRIAGLHTAEFRDKAPAGVDRKPVDR